MQFLMLWYFSAVLILFYDFFSSVCNADICNSISGSVDFFWAGNLLSIRFGKFVFYPKTNGDGLKPLLLIKEFLACRAHERPISQV